MALCRRRNPLMNPAYAAYRLIGSGLFGLMVPAAGLYRCFKGRHTDSLRQRLGRYPEALVRSAGGPPRIWLHAASVGEVGVAAAVMDALVRRMPACAFIVSTTTRHGQAMARDRFGGDTVCVYAPVDCTAAVRKSLAAFGPDILVLLETEIWPNWLIEARRMGIRTCIVNGRLSVRSLKGYLRVRTFIREVLHQVDAFSMMQAADAERMRRIGAPPERIFVNGNAKYDLLIRQTDAAMQQAVGRLYHPGRDQPVFVAGSIRRGEEDMILDVYSRLVARFPDTLLVVAPRHPRRAPRMAEKIRHRGFSCQMRTDLNPPNGTRTASVVVLDTIGELSAAYSLASVAFCGGSLVPLGGQNVLEPAVWGKPVLYGPWMEDFQDAKMLLENTGGGIQVADGRMLAEKVLYYLSNPDQAAAVGRRARMAVESHAGAADKHAAVVCRLLDGSQSFFNVP